MNYLLQPDSIFHEIECQMQPQGFPCKCDEIKDRRELEMQEALEAEATGN